MILKSLINTLNHTKHLPTLRLRHYLKNMDCDLLQPPLQVRLMKDLNYNEFRKTVKVPRLWVKAEKAHLIMPVIKNLLLKMERMKPVRSIKIENKQANEEGKRAKGADKELREFLLHPKAIKQWSDLPENSLKQYGIDVENFGYIELQLSYENWRADEIFKAVLPQEEEGFTSYSRIGHIVHINLREHLLPYKQLIGQVLLDKVIGCRAVVNKVANIENTYRNFQMELVCGEADYEVSTKENGINFQFDFSKVYWNPRLSTEHERIVQLLRAGDVLYDVFAGVGPFAVPAARKKCSVLANDLNPESFKWLQINMKRNKCFDQAKLFNMDGRDFICKAVKEDLRSRWLDINGKEKNYKIHITMNLPAMAIEFVSTFRGLFGNEFTCDQDFSSMVLHPLPLVHVYAFGKGLDTKQAVLQQLNDHLQMSVDDILEGIYFVRNVAPNKDMYRICFHLTKEILVENNNTEALERKRKWDSIMAFDVKEENKKCAKEENS